MPPPLLHILVSTASGPTTTDGALVAIAFVALALMLAYVRHRQRRHERELRDHDDQFRALAEHIPGVVFSYERLAGGPRQLRYLSPGLAELIGPVNAARVGARYDEIFELLHPEDRERLHELALLSHESRALLEIDLRLRHDCGEYIWIRTTSRPTDLDGGATRWHGVIFDITVSKRVEEALRTNEGAIRSLYEATASVEATTEQRIDQLLNVGRRCLGMELGLLGQIEGNRYTVVACAGPEEIPIRTGDAFELGDSLCRMTMQADGPVSYDHLGRTDFADHPAHRQFGLEAYCGARVVVQKRVFGTLSFSARTPRETPCTRAELDLLSLMARWVGGEIERDNARRELRWANDNLEQEVRQRTAELLATNRALREQVFERERAESELQRKHRQERLLFSELDHRVRNNLSSLMSLLDLTRRDSDDLDTFVDSIRGRIEAIAAVHTILSQRHWSTMSLRDLIDVLRPVEAPGTIEVTGDDVQIAARQANAFGMVLHELIANSLKYGAMSRERGRASLAWEVQPPNGSDGARRMRLSWRESGGPPIEGGVGRGSGTSIIEGLIGFELRGIVRMTYPRAGAQHEFTMLLDEVGESAKGHVGAGASARSR